MSHRQHMSSHLEKDPLHSAQRGHPEHTKDEAGVCEAYPGIIESSDIDPLHHERMKEEMSAASKAKGGQESNPGLLASAADMAAGAAKFAFSSVKGDEAGKQAGKESMFGSST